MTNPEQGGLALPSPEDEAQMRKRHVEWIGRPGYCECAAKWPCDAARLLARVDSETVSAEQVREMQYAHIGDDGEHLGPCVLVSDLPALGIEVSRG